MEGDPGFKVHKNKDISKDAPIDDFMNEAATSPETNVKMPEEKQESKPANITEEDKKKWKEVGEKSHSSKLIGSEPQVPFWAEGPDDPNLK